MLTNIAVFNYFFQAEEGDSSNSKSGAVITSQPKILAKRYISFVDNFICLQTHIITESQHHQTTVPILFV